MDPVNRRAVWALIRELKKDRIVILTTHSMEEGTLACVVAVERVVGCQPPPHPHFFYTWALYARPLLCSRCPW